MKAALVVVLFNLCLMGMGYARDRREATLSPEKDMLVATVSEWDSDILKKPA